MPERLLYSISTRGKMSFSNYYNAFDTIFYQVHRTFPDDVNLRRLKFQTLRLLDALGHCDVDYDKRCVYVCAPFLIATPHAGLSRLLLVGARSLELVTCIKKFAAENRDLMRLYIVHQRIGYPLLPPAIYLEVADTDLISKLSAISGISMSLDGPAAWHLVNFSSDIFDIEKRISFELRDEPNWPKRTFSTMNLTFDRYESENDGIRLIEYTNPRDQQKLHFLWQASNAAEVDRDWGRFLVLHKQRKSILFYDYRRFLLAVPTSVPMPPLISRALTLCTGRAPADILMQGKKPRWIPEECRFNIYQSVAPSIAEVVARKLGQELMEYDF